jgi:hypothetical protein
MQDPLVKSAEKSAAAGITLTRHQKWALVRRKTLQLLGGLIMEKNDEGLYVISIGRVAWWIAFLPAVGIWIASRGTLDAGTALKDISPNHYNILLVLAGYNMGKHLTNVANNFISKKNNQASNDADGPG